jgi:hypothetical protein
VQVTAFVVATLVLLPYAGLALAFMLLGYAISGGNLASVLQAILGEALWLIPWGFIGTACGVAILLALGVNPGTRKSASVILSVLAVASAVSIWALSTSKFGLGELAFLLPCLAVAGVGALLAVAS